MASVVATVGGNPVTAVVPTAMTRPLRQTGFDIQFSGSNKQAFAAVLDELDDGIASAADKQIVRDTLQAMVQPPAYKPSKELERDLQAAVARIAGDSLQPFK